MAIIHTMFLALGATALIAPAPLSPEEMFKGDSAATWSARSIMMAQIASSAAGTDPAGIRIAMARSCDGLTGEQMHHEYGKVPRWALGSQLDICSAYDGWAGKFGGSKGPCKMLEKGLKELENAQPGAAPDVVVEAAGELRTTATNLLAASKGTHACKL